MALNIPSYQKLFNFSNGLSAPQQRFSIVIKFELESEAAGCVLARSEDEGNY